MQEEKPIIKKYAKGGGKETLFRVTIRSQIRLISIMDSKANLIISINTMLITGVLTLLTIFDRSIHIWEQASPMGFLDQVPFFAFLVFSLLAMAYAILATKTDLNTGKFNVRNSPIQYTLKHMKNMDVDEYLEYMEDVLFSNERIYENLNLDMFFLSQVVSRKSRFLSISYTLFLGGIIIGVGLFLIFTFY